MFRTGCGCEFPDSCSGLGTLECLGCGGDICVCICGGELPCPGCDACLYEEHYGPEIDDEEVEIEEKVLAGREAFAAPRLPGRRSKRRKKG